MIMSTLMLASASGPKIAAATPGLSATLRKRDLRLVAREGDAGDDLLFHDILLVANQGAELGVGGIVERRSHIELDLVHHRHFDRAHLQHLGAERGHLEHFLERRPCRAGAPWERCAGRWCRRRRRRCRCRSGRRAAPRRARRRKCPSRRGRASSRGRSRRAGPGSRRRRRSASCAKPSMMFVAVDAGDARRAVRVVGEQRDLPALPRARVDAHVLQHDREQAGGDEFAGGDDGVIFGGIVERRGLLAPRRRARWSCPTSPRRRPRLRGPRRLRV